MHGVSFGVQVEFRMARVRQFDWETDLLAILRLEAVVLVWPMI